MPKVPALKDWRALALLSQQELADRAGVARSTIISIEAGRNARPITLRKIAQVLSLTPVQLLSLPDNQDRL